MLRISCSKCGEELEKPAALVFSPPFLFLLSARYKELPCEFYIPEPNMIGEQSKDNKQMRTVGGEATSEQIRISRFIGDAIHESYKFYEHLLESGCPRELARSVLPVGMYSHMFATVNLLNLLKFLTLRMHEHAQYEIRVYAEAMRDLAKTVAPICLKAWEENK